MVIFRGTSFKLLHSILYNDEDKESAVKLSPSDCQLPPQRRKYKSTAVVERNGMISKGDSGWGTKYAPRILQVAGLILPRMDAWFEIFIFHLAKGSWLGNLKPFMRDRLQILPTAWINSSLMVPKDALNILFGTRKWLSRYLRVRGYNRCGCSLLG